MEVTHLILFAIVPIFLIVSCGALARWLGWLDPTADSSLIKIVVNLLYPALILSNVLGNDSLRNPSNLLIPPILGLGFVVAGFVVSWVAVGSLKSLDHAERRTFSFITGIQNSIYFPLPIIALLFDRGTVGVLLVFNLGVEVAIWLIGVGFLISLNEPKPFLKRIINAPMVTIFVATWLNYNGLDRELPEFAFKTIGLLGQCAIPMGLILVGAIFADSKAVKHLTKRIDLTLMAIVVRIIILPLIYLIVAAALPLATELKQVVAIQAAMPCAVFPIVLSKHFGSSSDVAPKIVLGTTLISILTIPLWVEAGIYLLGL